MKPFRISTIYLICSGRHGTCTRKVKSEFSNQLTRNRQKIGCESMVFSSQLSQFPQIIIALDKYTGYMFTSSPNCMMSLFVAMEISCITNIGSISSKKIADVENCSKNVRF